MENQALDNSNMHFEHELWKGELYFWRDELKSFNKRLDELVKRWTDKKILLQLEHYQNEFIIQRDAIDDLLETIEQHEIRMAAQEAEELDTTLQKNHVAFRDRIDTQREIYAALKKTFFRFLEKEM